MLYAHKNVGRALCVSQECENECEPARPTYAAFHHVSTLSCHPESRLGDGDPAALGAKCIVTAMFCDIRGFSKIAEDFPPDALVSLLNEHFEAMTETLFDHHGALDKCFGDEMMAVFCGMETKEADAACCVRAALAMQQRNRELNTIRRKKKQPTFGLGIGINTGVVIAGYVGSPLLREFTVVGDTVNTARRLCSIAMPGQILVEEATYEMVASEVQAIAMGPVVLRGKSRTVHPYQVTGSLQEKMLICR
ncbi:MAG TPA: adenylate/guanylate cyclase domain-containing protein [Candidatus Hydrogenedentes bacterium]|nr:adenylate/guanylate cyclase domain-containing protein [Candidatus Hydrogenedentota bacterium]HQM49102.1 adenylate/guanylate cyclase domain-containing protein [Candidatus Hydrogenedentota bacterium]